MLISIVGFLCLLGGPIANRIGLRYTLLLGAVGYTRYIRMYFLDVNIFGNDGGANILIL
jgi:hypothetical protein